MPVPGTGVWDDEEVDPVWPPDLALQWGRAPGGPHILAGLKASGFLDARLGLTLLFYVSSLRSYKSNRCFFKKNKTNKKN